MSRNVNVDSSFRYLVFRRQRLRAVCAVTRRLPIWLGGENASAFGFCKRTVTEAAECCNLVQILSER